MSIMTFRDEENRVHVYYDDERNAPAQFTIWFEGRSRVVRAHAGELPGVVWERVLAEVRNMRHIVADAERRDPYLKISGLHRGNQYRTAHIYAGIEPSQEQVKGHMRQWIEWSLWLLASDRNDDHKERVEALCALADLYGMESPKKVEIALRVK